MTLSTDSNSGVRAAAHGASADAVSSAVSVFGAAVAPRLNSGVGAPEDHLGGPREVLLDTVAVAVGVKLGVVDESFLADLNFRPDYAAPVDPAGVMGVNGYHGWRAYDNGWE